MVQAARSPQPPSPAGGNQGSATRSIKSMWAALVLGILTAIFAWLWFGRVEEEKRSDGPEKQQTPVGEEEQRETAEETCACSNVDPHPKGAKISAEEPNIRLTVEPQQKGSESRPDKPSTQPIADHQEDGKCNGLGEPGTLAHPELQLEEPIVTQSLEAPEEGRVEEPSGPLGVEPQQEEPSTQESAARRLEESSTKFNHDREGARSRLEEPNTPLPLTQDASLYHLEEPIISQDVEPQQEGVGDVVEEPKPSLHVEKRNEAPEEGDHKVGSHPEDIQGESNGAGQIVEINQTLSHKEDEEHKDQVGQEPIADVTNTSFPESQIQNVSPRRLNALCENGLELTNEVQLCEQKGFEGIKSEVLTNSIPVISTSTALGVEDFHLETSDSSKSSEGLTIIQETDADDFRKNLDVPEVDKHMSLPLSFNGEESHNVSQCPEADNTKVKKIAAVQPMPQNVNVCFKVHYITSISQQIAVTGDHEELGCWKVYIPLTSDKDGFWTHSVLLPIDSSVEWKFVVVENGKIKRWEECSNRRLKTGHDDVNAHQWWGVISN
ncbi:starch-binding domain-containing protein 1 isoform X2 [Spea bombifrons]|uniref:starch-binding domain-containing protein 1 isoform X2 n=1 Tax=Spea bombifrons TaxID=233779 RepID=UPI00234AC82E|nr:starch-binding domain-containing protein 1 isoform X2 [Spea bombifrons]